jgi:hypothetical protein
LPHSCFQLLKAMELSTCCRTYRGEPSPRLEKLALY